MVVAGTAAVVTAGGMAAITPALADPCSWSKVYAALRPFDRGFDALPAPIRRNLAHCGRKLAFAPGLTLGRILWSSIGGAPGSLTFNPARRLAITRQIPQSSRKRGNPD